MNTVRIGDRLVGPGQPCYLVAEVGTTCLGRMDYALDLVKAAAEAGMDAVKFQMIDPTQLSDPSVQYRFSAGGQQHTMSMKEMFERLAFSDDQWREIRDACVRHGIHFFATVDYLEGVDRLERLDVPAHKIGAWDITYRPLIERIGATGRVLFADLGPATPEQVDEMIGWYRGAGGGTVLFMHDFHTKDDRQMNLRAVVHLNERYPWPAGWSSPARDHDLDFAALALGSAYIEKRLILSRTLQAFHADESLEPAELKAWVDRIRHVERALGEPVIRPSDEDSRQSRDYYRSVCVMQPVRAGEVFGPANLDGKRPGTGMPTSRLPSLYGRKAARDLAPDTLLRDEDVA